MKRQSIRQLLDGYKKKQFSPVEITREYVREIKNCDPVYNAYITVTKEHALRKAKQSPQERRDAVRDTAVL